MDELVIEDKKYVSSKRAAKMTGYAKDYIGQLCREGRVPARLVGRSWYVLESAIADHRFGTKEDRVAKESIFSSTWETPKYEPAEPAVLTVPEEEAIEVPEASTEHLQKSWRAWFDRVGSDPGEPVQSQESNSQNDAPDYHEESARHVSEETEGDTSVAIKIQSRPPRELLPTTSSVPVVQRVKEVAYEDSAPVHGYVRAVQTAAVLVGLISVAVAALGSGYFDEYIVSNKPVSAVAGVILHNK